MTTGAELSHTWLDKERARRSSPTWCSGTSGGAPSTSRSASTTRRAGLRDRPLHRPGRELRHRLRDDLRPGLQSRPGSPGGGRPRGVPYASNEVQRLVGIDPGGCFCEPAAEPPRGGWIGGPWSTACAGWRTATSATTPARPSTSTCCSTRAIGHGAAGGGAGAVRLPQVPHGQPDRVLRPDLRGAAQAKPGIDVRLNHYAAYPELMGLDLKGAGRYMDSVRSSDYSEQSGNPARMEGSGLPARRAPGHRGGQVLPLRHQPPPRRPPSWSSRAS